MQKILVTLILSLACAQLPAQIIGDAVFEEPQVLTIELTFQQPGFWDSLVANYESATYMVADVQISDNMGTYYFDSIGVRLKGNSSYGHPGNKKSFKIDFNKYISGQNYHDLKKLNFSNAFKDPTFMHEKIVLDISRDMDMPAPRANYADVFMNGTHWGFYVLIEQIDDQFLDWRFADDGGNLFKAGDAFDGPGNEANLVWYGSAADNYYSKYELENNADSNDWTDLIAFIDFINNSSDGVFTDSLDDYLDLEPFLRSIATDNLFSNLDSYINSARNYYIYHNQSAQQWQWVKWDCNETFGGYPGGLFGEDLTQLDINYINSNRPLVERIFENPGLYAQYQDALCQVYNSEFTNEKIDERITALYNLIQPYVYADDAKMYTDTQFENNLNADIEVSGPMPGSTQTIYGLRSFVAERRDAVAAQLDCNAVTIAHTETLQTALHIFPNPAHDYVQIENTNLHQTITIKNAVGETVMRINDYQNPVIDIHNLPAGIFVLELETGESKLFIKQ